jgi:hypothetical protein
MSPAFESLACQWRYHQADLSATDFARRPGLGSARPCWSTRSIGERFRVGITYSNGLASRG